MEHTLEETAYLSTIHIEDENYQLLAQTYFKIGAEYQKTQFLSILKAIAGWAGNLPDDRLTSKTGANDASFRGQMLVSMRQLAITAIKKFEPDYEL